MKVKIERGIPMPTRYSHGQFASIATQMQVGDSVKVPKESAVPMCQAIKRTGGIAAMRKINDTTWRVWRTK